MMTVTHRTHSGQSSTPRFDAVLAAPFGKVGVRLAGAAISSITFLPESVATAPASTAFAQQAVSQIEHYLADPSARFTLPLARRGSSFQHRVWQAIASIDRGQVLTYGELARRIGSVPRAVGQACGSNPFPLIVPCHRVVAANGIGGFAHDPGEGFLRTTKRWLLTHEGAAGAVPDAELARRAESEHQMALFE